MATLLHVTLSFLFLLLIRSASSAGALVAHSGRRGDGGRGLAGHDSRALRQPAGLDRAELKIGVYQVRQHRGVTEELENSRL